MVRRQAARQGGRGDPRGRRLRGEHGGRRAGGDRQRLDAFVRQFLARLFRAAASPDGGLSRHGRGGDTTDGRTAHPYPVAGRGRRVGRGGGGVVSPCLGRWPAHHRGRAQARTRPAREYSRGAPRRDEWRSVEHGAARLQGAVVDRAQGAGTRCRRLCHDLGCRGGGGAAGPGGQGPCLDPLGRGRCGGAARAGSAQGCPRAVHPQRRGGGVTRGFEVAEYRARVGRAQAEMAQAGLGALLLTTEPELRYFTGFLTRFWESPSRPWFLVLPAQGDPVAVIPAIGAALMATTWIGDIRTWAAPDLADDGVSLVADALRECGGPVGVPSPMETHLRMPLADFERLKQASGLGFTDDRGIVAECRAIKSEAEIAKIARSCAIAGRAFARLDEIAAPGVALSRVFRDFQRLLLEEGADWVPYLAGGAGPDGYADVISPASDAPLAEGDVLMLDTGAVRDGYFCDFDRNFAIARSTAAQRDAQARLIEATLAGEAAARAGMRACDLWQVMADIVGGSEAAGRLGHGLGMQLTEGLSLTAKDQTVLQPGMVITLEPGLNLAPGRIMVHEENIVITEGAPRRLSRFATSDLPVI